eukprot:TRINITY_DN13864_c0_g3_i1.p1 TRINITY_DN13864_c0_g3~~TRINITY_DN13864_c0_g3_i1.p1  ORF type:complete len:435 (+),score=103.12 TRINITY_DN13864_c0_g3_i1:94-1398(+)
MVESRMRTKKEEAPKKDDEEDLPDFDEDDEDARKRALSSTALTPDSKRYEVEDNKLRHDELLRRLEEAEKNIKKHEKRLESHDEDRTRAKEDLVLIHKQALYSYLQWIVKEREEASRRAVIKGWWRFQFDSKRSVDTMCWHREEICDWTLQDAHCRSSCLEITSRQGTTLLPITTLVFKDSDARNEYIKHMKEKHGGKVQEWATDQSKNLYWASGGGGGHRPLLIEPAISEFDRKQSYVLKCVMSATKNVLNITEYRHDWKEMSIYDDNGYICWIDFDVEYSVAKCYFAEEKVTTELRQEFEEAISAEMRAITSGQQKGKAKGFKGSKGEQQKGKGKGKGKDKDKEEDAEMAEEDPAAGAYVPGEDTEAYKFHLATRMKKIGMSAVQTQNLRLRTAYLMEYRYIALDQFTETYNASVEKAVDRLAEPIVGLNDL